MNASLDYHPLYAVDEPHRIEVQEQAYLNSGQSKIGQELRFVNRRDAFDRFDLDQHSLRYDQIGTKSALHLYAVVEDRNRVLALKRNFATASS